MTDDHFHARREDARVKAQALTNRHIYAEEVHIILRTQHRRKRGRRRCAQIVFAALGVVRFVGVGGAGGVDAKEQLVLIRRGRQAGLPDNRFPRPALVQGYAVAIGQAGAGEDAAIVAAIRPVQGDVVVGGACGQVNGHIFAHRAAEGVVVGVVVVAEGGRDGRVVGDGRRRPLRAVAQGAGRVVDVYGGAGVAGRVGQGGRGRRVANGDGEGVGYVAAGCAAEALHKDGVVGSETAFVHGRYHLIHQPRYIT